MAPKSQYRLVTVNTARERAHRLIGCLVDNLKDQYTIVHVANCEKIEQVEASVRQYMPDLLFCASMWTTEEADEIQSIAKQVKPNIVTYAIPQGLQVEEGPEAVVNHLNHMVPQVLRKHFGETEPQEPQKPSK